MSAAKHAPELDHARPLGSVVSLSDGAVEFCS